MTRIFKELGWFFKKEWYKFLLVLIFTFAFTYAVTLPPNYIGNIIDRIIQKDLTKALAVKLCILMAAASIIIYLSAIIKNYFMGKLHHKLFYQLKKRFIVQVFKQDGDFFEKYHAGDLMNRATGDINMISRVSTNILFHFVDAVVMLIISFLLMVRLNLSLTLLAIIPLPLITALVMYLRPKIIANWKQVRKKVSHLNDMAMESVTNVKLIRGFVKEKDDEEKLRQDAEGVFITERKAVLMQALFFPSFRMITVISQGIALAYGAYLITHQLDFTVGNLITFNLYLQMFANPLFRLGNQITRLAQSGVSFDRLNDIMYTEPTIIDKPNAVELTGVDSVSFRHLSFRYPNDEDYTIKDINIDLKRGQTLGIVGKTGSGKTTLIKQLLRLYPISVGSIYINGRIISDYKKESIRKNIAYVPQEHALFSRTVLENLKLGDNENTNLTIEEAIELADFEKDLPFLDNGLRTIVGESGVTLSGGQKQRLSIARAFLKNAEVLILDDSLSAVDGMTEKNISENLRTYRQNRTNIVCSHRLSVVEDADKIIVLDQGKIVEEGTHQQLMVNQKWYYQQYILQQMESEDEA